MEMKMLRDLLLALMDAKTKQEKERAYEDLRLVGMDRRTADYCVEEIRELKEIEEKRKMREDKEGAADALIDLLYRYDPGRWNIKETQYEKTLAGEFVRVIYPDYTITIDVTADSVAAMLIDILKAIM